jgi:hypothetical protein
MKGNNAGANDQHPPESARLRVVADSWADETIAPELRRLARAWEADRDRLLAARRSDSRSRIDLAAAEDDHHRAISELMNALVTTEIRLREALKEPPAPQGRRLSPWPARQFPRSMIHGPRIVRL